MAQITVSTSRVKLASAMRRRGWVLGVAAISVALLAFATSRISGRGYRGQVVMLVNSHPSAQSPGSATEAAKLALSYQSVIAQDVAVLTFVGHQVNRTAHDVQGRLSVVNPTDTALLQISYTDTTADAADLGANAAAASLTGPQPLGPALPGPGTLLLVKSAHNPSQTGTPAATALALGLFLGLVLGGVLMITWERADPRLDEPQDADFNIPVSLVQNLTAAGAGALIQRWTGLAMSDLARIALVPATAEAGSVAQPVARWLSGGATGGVPGPGHAEVVPAGVPGSDDPGEAEALRSELTVLLVTSGTPRRGAIVAMDLLEHFGARPAWILMVPPPRRGSATRALSGGGGGGGGGRWGVRSIRTHSTPAADDGAAQAAPSSWESHAGTH